MSSSATMHGLVSSSKGTARGSKAIVFAFAAVNGGVKRRVAA